MTPKQLSVAVIGASGYAGGELLRLLLSHPFARLVLAVSESYSGQPLSAAFPGIRFTDLKFSSFDKFRINEAAELIFLAQDHGVAMRYAPDFLSAGKKVIDISADFRLKDPAAFHLWYKHEHSARELLAQAVYGLPEIFGAEIQKAQLVANPGCYPTASALALAPLLSGELIDFDSIVIDAKSGVSGAGRAKHSLDFHFPELNENFRAYGIAGTHRHTPEIEQTLSLLAGKNVVVSFTPHLLPISRGILASCYARLRKPVSASELISRFSDFYREHAFVTVLEEGKLPTTKAVSGTNQCHIGIGVDSRTERVTVLSAIDNLNKGAAGQAVQNMNLMCGFPETAGLEGAALWP